MPGSCSQTPGHLAPGYNPWPPGQKGRESHCPVWPQQGFATNSCHRIVILRWPKRKKKIDIFFRVIEGKKENKIRKGILSFLHSFPLSRLNQKDKQLRIWRALLPGPHLKYASQCAMNEVRAFQLADVVETSRVTGLFRFAQLDTSNEEQPWCGAG